MKYFIICLLLLIGTSVSLAQNMDAKQLNQKMTEIRRNTDWDDPAAAKKANDEIKELSRQLMLWKQKGTAKNDDKVQDIKNENANYNAKILNQIMKAVDQGENGDILLGEPVREEVIEEYKDDESPVIKSQEYLNEMTLLVIDMSLKTVQRTIDQMGLYKSIKTLIITGGTLGAPVDLNFILEKAKNYPLESLYIINFGVFVTSIPKLSARFANLKLISIINNKVNALPDDIASFTSLKELYIDKNPVSTLLPFALKLKQLDTLGIAKTNISKSEIDKLKQQLPNCKILP